MHKRNFLSALFVLSATAAFPQPPVSTPSVVAEGREQTRTEFMSYDRREDAVTYDYDRSPFYLPLTGEWDFREAESTHDLDMGFYTYESQAPQGITVPGDFTLVPHGDLTKESAPTLPTMNRIGQYRARFNVPLMWLDRDIFVRIDGFRSGITLYVNGEKAGYSEDGGTPAEFNISPFVTDGINTIGIEVYQWTTGNWVDNFITSAGIEGGVFIHSQPKIHIRDFTVSATLDSTYTHGQLEVAIELINRMNYPDSVQVYYDLMDAKGDIIRFNNSHTVVPGMGGRDTVRFTGVVPRVNQWDPDSPYLYHLMMRIRHEGRFTEYVPYRIGFFRWETKEGKTIVNGKATPLVIEEYTWTGSSYSDDSIRADLGRIKNEGANTVHCTYHPRKNRVYELCAEAGLMIIDEANLNAALTGTDRNVGGTVGNDPAFLEPYLFRTSNSILAHRNKTGLVMWSLGTTAGSGFNIYRSYDRMKKLDSVRPVVYRPAYMEWCTDAYLLNDDLSVLRSYGERRDKPVLSDGLSASEIRKLFMEIPYYTGGFLPTEK